MTLLIAQFVIMTYFKICYAVPNLVSIYFNKTRQRSILLSISSLITHPSLHIVFLITARDLTSTAASS